MLRGVTPLRQYQLALALLVSAACVHRPALRPAPDTLAHAEAGRAALLERAPRTFRYVHQVVARYGPTSFVMTGYLVARASGNFLVSGMAPFGPKLFEVSKVSGRWQAKAYAAELAERMDVTNVGRAVERIYLVRANGPLSWDGAAWTARDAISSDPEVDAVETFRAPATLAITRQRYFHAGRAVLDIHYQKLEQISGEWIARYVRLEDARGFSLELSVSDYKPDIEVGTDVL